MLFVSVLEILKVDVIWKFFLLGLEINICITCFEFLQVRVHTLWLPILLMFSFLFFKASFFLEFLLFVGTLLLVGDRTVSVVAGVQGV